MMTKMFRNGLYPLVAVCFVGAVAAQNLVPDPGFENWNGTIGANPNTLGGLLLWDEVNGTPDHHHQLNPPGNNLTSLQPCPLGAGQNDCGTPYMGQAVLGAYKANGSTGTKEWAGIALSSPMVPGQPYKVGYWIQNKKDNPNFIMETNQWGMYFANSMVAPVNPNTHNFVNNPSEWVTCSQVINDTIWHYLEWCYVPPQAYTHIYVGYVGDVINSTINAWSNSASVGFYVWIDEVFVEPLTLQLTTSPDVAICTGDSTLIWASSPDLAISWDGGVTTDTAIWVSPTVTTTYFVEGVSSGGCSVIDSVTVSVTNCNCTIVLQTTVTGTDDTSCPGSACIGSAEATPVNGTAPYSFVWDDPGMQNTALATALCAGTYSCIVQDYNGCQDTVNVTLAAAPIPSLSFGVTDESCLGVGDGSIDLTVTGGQGPFAYLWSNAAVSEDISGLVGGMYSVGVTDAFGCTHVDSAAVLDGPAGIPVNITQVPSFCEGDAALAIVATPTGGVWSGTGVDPVSGSFDPAVGVGDWEVIYTVAGACGGADTADVVVSPLPLVAFTASPTSGCGPLDVLFTATSYQPGESCDWDLGDGNSSQTPGALNYTYFSTGVFDVSLTVTSAAGCSTTFTEPDMIEVFATPIADFASGFPNGPLPGQIVQFADLSSGAITSWSWDLGDGSTSMLPSPQHVYNEPGSYSVELTVMTDDGCSDVFSQVVTIVEDVVVYIPNAFTPNGDGVNDLFGPVVEGISTEKFSFIIFDRWGGILFETNKVGDPWNGSFGGSGEEPVASGVYAWKLVAKSAYSGKRVDLIGHVSLLK